MRKYWLQLFLISVFGLIGGKALLHSGLYTAHDIIHQVVRLYYYMTAVRDGQFTPYWIGTLANGYGYPLFFFSYNLPWLIGLPLFFLGFSYDWILKILFLIAYFFSGWTMFALTLRLFRNKWAATLSSIIYLWTPYHFLNVYVSAALGSVFIFLVLPMSLLGLILLTERNHLKSGLLVFSLGMGGMILSHLISVFLCLPLFLAILLWIIIEQPKQVFADKWFIQRNLILGVLLTLALCCFYLLPAVVYSKDTIIHNIGGFSEVYKLNFLDIRQLVYSKWGYGPIVKFAKEGEISFQVGVAQWIALLIAVGLLVFSRAAKKIKIGLVIFVALFGLDIFLMLDPSKPFWDVVTHWVVVDFPHRLLLPLSLVSSIITGYVYLLAPKRFQAALFITLICIMVYTNRNHINVNQYTHYPIEWYLSLEKTTNTYHEYFPSLANKKLLEKQGSLTLPEDEFQIISNSQTTNQLLISLRTPAEATFSVRQLVFPGQELYIDGQSAPLHGDNQGLVASSMSAGTHTLSVEFHDTLLIKLSKLVSLFGVGIVMLLLFKSYESNRRDARLQRG